MFPDFIKDAIRTNKLEVLETILSTSSFIDIKNNVSHALFCSTRYNKYKLVKHILTYYSPYIENHRLFNSIGHAVTHNYIKVYKLLINVSEIDTLLNINNISYNLKTAVLNNSVDIIRYIFINYPDKITNMAIENIILVSRTRKYKKIHTLAKMFFIFKYSITKTNNNIMFV